MDKGKPLPKELFDALESGLRIGKAARNGATVVVQSSDPVSDADVSRLASLFVKLLRTLSRDEAGSTPVVLTAAMIAVRAVIQLDCPKELQAAFVQRMQDAFAQETRIEVLK